MAGKPEDLFGNDPEDNYFFTEKPKSAEEAIARAPSGNEISLTKAALVNYIKEWLMPGTDANKLLLQRSPAMSRFVTEIKTVDGIDNGSLSWEPDPTARKIQVAQLFEDMHKQVPAILVANTGYTNRSPGLGAIHGQRYLVGRHKTLTLQKDLLISVDINIITLDQSSTNTLTTFIAEIFGNPLGTLLVGNLIQSSSPLGSYQIVLPSEMSVPNLSSELIEGDSQNAQWMTTLSMDIHYSGSQQITGSLPIRRGDTRVGAPGGSLGVPGIADGSALSLKLVGSTTATVGREKTYKVVDPNGYAVALSSEYKIVVSDFKKATFSTQRMVFKARRPGTVELRLVHIRQTEVLDNGVSTARKVVSSITITSR